MSRFDLKLVIFIKESSEINLFIAVAYFSGSFLKEIFLAKNIVFHKFNIASCINNKKQFPHFFVLHNSHKCSA